ncbi:hypothetical protein LHP98_04865 [Rhodobacter sp. Har01]|uniref:EF-hand domain-containing protein n=1 Tax=Rhodobacter sp. Har01 TaxID=2883999 RepID=UPI001D0734F2|nr:hypothetical protein [Rhodobacter sp. Har01]MCB6177461.1 hypothetical protein [Rhodobacter sp. Har01]
MTRSRRFALGLVLALGSPFAAEVARAEGQGGDRPSEAEQALDRALRQAVERAATTDQMQATWLQVFATAERDGAPGLGPLDRELSAQMDLARHRARRLAQMLEFDLNGDFVVTVEELRPFAQQKANQPLRSGDTEVEPTEAQKGQIVEAFLAEVLALDANGNGRLDADELAALNDRDRRSFDGDRGIFAFAPLLDADADGVLTRAEHLAGLLSATEGLDADKDGRLTEAERAAFLQRPPVVARPIDPAEVLIDTYLRPECRLNPVPDAAQVVAVAGYEGAALSTLRIGREGSLTTVADVIVPEGEGKLFVVADFQEAVILRFSGAVGRINGVIGLDAAVATMGLERRQLKRFGTITPPCTTDLWDPEKKNEPAPLERLTAALGRPPLALVAAYTVGAVDLGRAEVLPLAPLPGARSLPGDAPAAAIWAEMLRHNPGGLVDIAAEDVVAPYQTAPYTVLPQEAGLAQLVEQGLLTPQPRGPAENMVIEDENGRITLNGKVIFPGHGDDMIGSGGLAYTEEAPKTWVGRKQAEYVVEGPITLPDGLQGSHSVIFLLPKGVEMPKGDPGHSKIRPQD